MKKQVSDALRERIIEPQKSSHTPGPWRFRPMEIIEETERLRAEAGLPPKDTPEHERYYRDNNGDWIVGCEDGRLAAVAFKGKAKRGQGYNAPDPEGFANARLIAAAPEMLDALKWAVEKLDECGKQVEFTLGMVRSLQGCRDAISKAEGGQ